MTNMYINDMTALWNNSGTFYTSIKMNVTNSGSLDNSRLIDLQVAGTSKFSVDKDGDVTAAGSLVMSGSFSLGGAMLPATDNLVAIGSLTYKWSDLFLGSGAVINFDAGDVLITHAANTLAFTGGTSYTFDPSIVVTANDAVPTLTMSRSDTVSPTSARDIGSIDFNGENTSGLQKTYASLKGWCEDPAIGTEDGWLYYDTILNGVSSTRGNFGSTAIFPDASGGLDLGTTALPFGNVFLKSGGKVDFAASDVTITHSANTLTFAGGTAYVFDTTIQPDIDNGGQLGTGLKSWSDLYLADGAVIDFHNGNVKFTHSADVLTITSGTLKVPVPGNTTTSVATIDATQTLTNKTINLTNNTLTGTKAQFNAAMSDADFATLTGTETLTNKTISGGSISGVASFSVLDSSIVCGSSVDDSAFGIVRPITSGYTYLYGGTSSANGAYILLIGETYSTTSKNSIVLGTNGATRYQYHWVNDIHYWYNGAVTPVNTMSLNDGHLTITGQISSLTADVGTFASTGSTNGWQSHDGTQYSSRATTSDAYHYAFYNINDLVGSIRTAASATSFHTTSDARLKENFRSFDSGAILDAINAYQFDWKAGGSGYGVKAQECHPVFPDAIAVGGDDPKQDPWSADYSKFVPLLLAEIKALRARVAALEGAA